MTNSIPRTIAFGMVRSGFTTSFAGMVDSSKPA